MADVTNWLRQLGKPVKRQCVLIKGVPPVVDTGQFKIWLTDWDNRVLRCKLTMMETTALGAEIRKYLAYAREEA